jgi:hypothetical protein
VVTGYKPNETNANNANNVRREGNRHFRNIGKLKLMNLKLIVRSKVSGICIGASVTLIRVTRLELI